MMLEANIAPRKFSLVMARLSSSAARSGACIGKVAMPMKRVGWAAMCLAIWSFWMAAVTTVSAASWLYR